ncbi:glycine betaine ABC transporter substrate-binding protein [Carnobacterium pleistocenium]|uniref:glycine betaine ABC transporter substrate-binding protein n=1 Tax=Carnobacterium pleistocenium TaxID=181073 RepID=UPI00068E4A3B|nr:glycine betaine ABC transporter substrate-binding protein [Carnobacterium pleistocenium]
MFESQESSFEESSMQWIEANQDKVDEWLEGAEQVDGETILFEAIANGEADASLALWLPTTHASFYKKPQDNMIDLSENLTGAQNGLLFQPI